MGFSRLGVIVRPDLPRGWSAAFLALIMTPISIGCGAVDDVLPPIEELRCPIRPENEFGPSHCAVIQGIARDRDGKALSGVVVRVDSVICCILFVYSSPNAVTRSDGSFDLEVARSFRLRTPPTVPDTVTMNLLLYRDPQPAALDPPDARAPVLLWFAEVGKPVPPSVVDVRFDYP